LYDSKFVILKTFQLSLFSFVLLYMVCIPFIWWSRLCDIKHLLQHLLWNQRNFQIVEQVASRSWLSAQWDIVV